MLLLNNFVNIITLIGAMMSFQVQGLAVDLPTALSKRQGQCLSRRRAIAAAGYLGTWTIDVSEVGNGIFHRPVPYPDIGLVTDIASAEADTMRFRWQGASTMPRNTNYFLVPGDYLRENGVPASSPNIVHLTTHSECDVTYDRGAGVTAVSVKVYRVIN
ncbi:hypothetical protein COCMIDRAFT_10445 [Bipolaris oryzae ATCC 44560]|uniref:Uncharacterized protein n=1 Tax=Bipolaris oryzae ATCC 44560 TaxID=930090 RepID=W6YP68_COCMI|nr:uncharacterized protein COCMIDRAFT_10445 [Bipolaris oryzae ATCC 44560]EUC39470.1 hypothetical protein COCMIDRAFT_10445 [Bipolaris oryzae ATCC 44560]